MGFLNKKSSQISCNKNIKGYIWCGKCNEKFLDIDETPPSLEKSFKAATKLRYELPANIEMESIPIMELSNLSEDIHAKTREASQSIDFGM